MSLLLEGLISELHITKATFCLRLVQSLGVQGLLTPVAMVLMLESFPHHPQSSHSLPYLNHWLRGLGTGLGSEQYLLSGYS